mmetsp:Transcript_15091/g.15213  ORF Transcript_15091/g.15213 Transcript_15091/m.15213 type:complete len:744 (+) Transcript_15091:226-2457(+)
MKKAPAPPRSRAPISEEQLNVVKKKVAAPSGPRPDIASTFKAPKKYDETGKLENQRDKSDNDDQNSDDNDSKGYDNGKKKGKKKEITDDYDSDDNKYRRGGKKKVDIDYDSDDYRPKKGGKKKMGIDEDSDYDYYPKKGGKKSMNMNDDDDDDYYRSKKGGKKKMGIDEDSDDDYRPKKGGKKKKNLNINDDEDKDDYPRRKDQKKRMDFDEDSDEYRPSKDGKKKKSAARNSHSGFRGFSRDEASDEEYDVDLSLEDFDEDAYDDRGRRARASYTPKGKHEENGSDSSDRGPRRGGRKSVSRSPRDDVPSISRLTVSDQREREEGSPRYSSPRRQGQSQGSGQGGRRRLKDDELNGNPDEESEFTYEDNYPKRASTTQFRNPMSGDSGSNSPNPNTGSKAGIFNFKPILHSTYRELRIFVMTPPPPGLVVRCYIEREKSFSPFYSLCADLEDGTGRELIVCKKVLRSFSSHYVFSLKAEDLYRKREQRSRLYLGKLRSTNSAEYVLFDNGVMDKPDDEGDMMYEHSEGSAESPQEAKDGRPDVDCSLYRQQMAVVHYNTKTRPVPENLRGMEVCVPVPTHAHKLTVEAKDISHNVNSPTSASATANTQAALNSKSPNIQHPFQQIRDSGRQNELMANRFFVMHEKQSKYDPLSSCLVDFKGRANIASVKNFQLIESPPETGFGSDISARVRGTAREDRDRSEILLQMGKATDQCFNLDFRAPLTMLQAFAIAVARFDAKLSW